MININMRCIEMSEAIDNRQLEVWLTLTWDVLKWRYTTLMTWNVAD